MCSHIMTVLQIVSGQIQRCVLTVTDRLIAQPQSEPAYLDRMLIPVPSNIKLSIAALREIRRPTCQTLF